MPRGSPIATLFITVLVLWLLTEVFIYQLVIKERADPGYAEAASVVVPFYANATTVASPTLP